MLRVGLVGVGFMGWIHYLAYQRVAGVELVGFASRDPQKRAGDWRGIQGNFGPPGEQIDVSKMAAYATIDELLADDSIDVVDICLPPHLHVESILASLAAKKHVLCEKPLALNSRDAKKVVEAATKANKLLMVAHVLPFIGPFQWAFEAVQSGNYGPPIGGMFKRAISNPDWIPDFFDAKAVGGPLIDLNVHDAHFIRMIFGMPNRVTGIGRMHVAGATDSSTVKFAHACYEFANPNVVVASTGGVLDGPARPFTHGFELQLHDATIQFEFAALSDGCETMPLKLIHRDGSIERPTLPAGDDVTAFEAEIWEVVKSVESGKATLRLDAVTACDAIRIAECIQQSVIERRTVDV